MCLVKTWTPGLTKLRGVDGGHPWAIILATRRAKDLTGHNHVGQDVW
jgi:hypothetical protein